MNKNEAASVTVDQAESSARLAEENAALHAMLQSLCHHTAEFARNQADNLVGIHDMTNGLTRNQGRASNHVFLAYRIEMFTRECLDEAHTYQRYLLAIMGSLDAMSVMKHAAATGRDNAHNLSSLVFTTSKVFH
ncbi:hypothetical protein WN982_14175 [Paraburkholderia sp. IMGN_8]|uniref:hypothetical protein n=1 Tax=Paraburkholderia sp. IMGN_8 TaxID=3136564 RepID=UPI0031015BE3